MTVSQTWLTASCSKEQLLQVYNNNVKLTEYDLGELI